MAPAYSCGVLEINVISAQDLASVSKNMKTYAVAWVNTDPMRKLTTRVDHDNRANPIWNERFVFRVDSKLLGMDASAAIVIEIYTAAWAKDALLGTVNVLLSDLFAPWSGFDDDSGNSNMRLVTLQVRRPSGRLQGFLRLGVALLDGTQRSMPLFVELPDRCALNGTNYRHATAAKEENAAEPVKRPLLRRTHSDQTDLTTSTEDFSGNYAAAGAVAVPGRRLPGGLLLGNIHGVVGGGTDSMINGSLCSSDVGPSASVVAAAIAQGLYDQQQQQKRPATNNKDDASSIFEGTTECTEHKIERWRKETAMKTSTEAARDPISTGSKQDGVEIDAKVGNKKLRRQKARKGLFSCFSNVFGCEISITCGSGGDSSSTKKRNNKNKVANLSAVDETFSQSVV